MNSYLFSYNKEEPSQNNAISLLFYGGFSSVTVLFP